jgi:hypothetical protein
MLAIKFCFTVLALSAQASRVLERSSTFRAKMWLKTHDPSGDEAGMQDLKNSDPNAFAIVQALLTKKSLGLLDPNHPSASMTGEAKHERKTFQEEAEEQGLTQDSPSPEVSEMEMKSSMPYPTVGSASAAPYPEVHASHDPWNYKTVHSDDDLVNSVIGQDAAPAQVQSQDNSLSLSAVTAQEQQSMPAPVEPRESAPAPLDNGMPNLNWGNPMAGTSEQVAAPAAQQPAQEEANDEDKSLSLSAVRNQEESRLGITEPVGRFAPPAPVPQRQPAPVMYAQPAPVMNEQPAPTQDLAAQSIIAQESLAAVTAPIVQPAAVNMEAQEAPWTPPAAQPAPVSMEAQEAPWTPPAEPKLAMNSYASHVSSYRSSYRMNLHAQDAIPSSDDILSLRKANMGNSYTDFLKQARTNRWKRAMDVTMNMKPVGAQKNNAYLADLS